MTSMSDLKSIVDKNISIYISQYNNYLDAISFSDTVLSMSIKMIFHDFILDDSKLIIDYIEKHPEEINVVDHYNRSPLFLCSVRVHKVVAVDDKFLKIKNIIFSLIDAGANVNFRINNISSLSIILDDYMISAKAVDIIIKLIESGSDISSTETSFDAFIGSHHKYTSHPLFKYFIENNKPLIKYKDDWNVNSHIENFKLRNQVKILAERNVELENKVQVLKLELKLIPGSPYVKYLGQHFKSLA